MFRGHFFIKGEFYSAIELMIEFASHIFLVKTIFLLILINSYTEFNTN